MSLADGQAWQQMSPDWMQALYSQGAMGPNWSSKGYTPWDGGDQKSALNFNQDLLSWLMNPQIGVMAGVGAYNPEAMKLAMQDYQPGRTEGTDFLNAVAAQSPKSPQGMIAMLIGKGRTAEQAYAETKAAIEAKGGKMPTIHDKDGKEIDDPQILQDARNWWENYLKDKPSTGTQDPYARAGFSDPSARFTPDMFAKKVTQKDGTVVPEYDVFGQKADKSADQVKKTQAALDAYYKTVNGTNKPTTRWNGSQNQASSFGGVGFAVDPYDAMQRTVEEHSYPMSQYRRFYRTGVRNGDAVKRGGWLVDGFAGSHDHLDVAPTGFNNVMQDALGANLQHGRDANSAFLSGAFATAKANQAAGQYGSPFAMEMAQRMALARQLGIAQ